MTNSTKQKSPAPITKWLRLCKCNSTAFFCMATFSLRQGKEFRPDVRNRLLFSALRRKPAGVEAKMTAHAMSKEKNAPGATSVPAKDRLRKGKLRAACRSLQRGRASMFFAWHTADCSAKARVEKIKETGSFPMLPDANYRTCAMYNT